MEKHSRYSPSAAHRWLNCTGSVALINRLLDEGRITLGAPSEAAQEGTEAHEYVARRLLSLFGERAITPLKPNKDYVYHHPDKALADRYVSYVKNLNCYGDAIIEQPVHITNIQMYDVFGTVDFAGIDSFATLHVVDFKFGKGIKVHAKDNPQLMLYALGVKQCLFNTAKIEKVCLHIVQPRFLSAPESYHEMTPDELRRFDINVLQKVVMRLKHSEGDLIPGDHCHWCPAIAFCKANHSAAEKAAKTEFEALQDETIEELIKLYSMKARIHECLERIEEHLLLEALKGTPIPGYELHEGHSRSKFRYSGCELVHSLFKLGIDTDLCTEVKPLSLTELKKRLDINQYNKLVDNLVIRGEPMYALKPINYD